MKNNGTNRIKLDGYDVSMTNFGIVVLAIVALVIIAVVVLDQPTREFLERVFTGEKINNGSSTENGSTTPAEDVRRPEPIESEVMIDTQGLSEMQASEEGGGLQSGIEAAKRALNELENMEK